MGQNKISDFQREYQITDREGTPRKIDIYFETLDGSEYCVQMDGGYHPDIIQKHSKDEFHPLPIQDFIPDIMKEYYCEDNGITLTRVDCYQSDFNYIKSELFKTELPDVVDLSEIDWKEVEQYCGTSLMADVCKYKADHPNKFAPEVAKIFGINPSTVRNYWHWGTDLGLCKYDPNEAKARETKLRIPVTVLDENTNVISEYPSITKWVEDSPNVLGGYKMTKKMMENRHKKYHGQPFEFVTPDNNFKVLITVSERK